MEPLLELVDRISATVWVFYKYMPPEDFRSTDAAGPRLLTNASSRLKIVAKADYAKLQELLDLYKQRDPDTDYFADPLAWVTNEPLSRLQRARRAFSHDKPPEHDETRKAAAEHVVSVLESRIKKLQKVWDDMVALQEDISSPQSLLDYCTRSGSLSNSDELFDLIARWIALPSLTLAQRKELATEFLPFSVGDTEGGRARFLMESNINIRALELTGKFRLPKFRVRPESTSLHGILQEPIAPRKGDLALKTAIAWQGCPEVDRLDILLNRDLLRTLCCMMDVAVPFSLVFSDELDEIARAREMRLNPDPMLTSRQMTQSQGAKSSEIEQPKLRDGTMPPDPPNSNRPQAAPASGFPVPARHLLPQHIAFNSCLFGVALSGGGIRSATFALGLIQAMADRNVLPYIDILSSVSGGGYFSSFLVAWIKRRGGIHSVQESLRGYAANRSCQPQTDSNLTPPDKGLPPNQNPQSDHLRPVRLLREYARYLAPEDGLFSADSWTIGATWIRNTLLNLVVLILLFAGMLLVPRVAVVAMHLMAMLWDTSKLSPFNSSLRGGALFLPICMILGWKNLRTFGTYQQRSNEVTRGWGDAKVVGWIVVPLLGAGAFYAAAIWNSDALAYPFQTSLAFALNCFLGLLLMIATSFNWEDPTSGKSARAGLLVCIAFTSGVGFLLMCLFCFILQNFGVNTMRGVWITASLGPPLMMLVIAITVVAMLGFAGTLLSDEQREWWGRLGAWLAIITFGWITISAISFFSPLWIAVTGLKATVWAGAAGLTWSAITAAGLKLAFSPKSSSAQSDRSQLKWRTWILNAAPIVFVIGLLSLTSFFVFWFSSRFLDMIPERWHPFEQPASSALCCSDQPIRFAHMIDHYWALLNPHSALLLVLAGGLLGLSQLLAKRVGVNTFSMHHFYRNRLVRAYLGASRLRAHREPNLFTGFDSEDDIRLHRIYTGDQSDSRDLVTDCQLSYRGPFPIINTALNVTKGQDLGIQQRRAESFIFTPIWSGFDYMRKQTMVRKIARMEFGFRQTQLFGNQGAYIGTAMAVSGAAFSSNAGFHTSPPLAFLLTVFGVRLGWWAGNPRKDTWSEDSPSDGLEYLANELTANTSTDEDFVLLTDGGHFENMGLYELVRRRCRFIVVSDAEQDEKFKLEGIGGAVRKCRTDFGVVIDLNLKVLQPLGDPAKSKLHYSVGSIRYPGEETCGTLVYVKASLTGDESVDLIEFGQRHPEFPHTPTINQMFDESHFESYRELGHHVGSTVFQKNWERTETITSSDALCAEVRRGFEQITSDWERLKTELDSHNSTTAAPGLVRGDQ